MSIYSTSCEEALRTRRLVNEWTAEGFLTNEQKQRLTAQTGQQTVPDLRTTNIYLRLVLFVFTLIVVAAAAALFFEVFLSPQSQQFPGNFLLSLSAICYAAAEVAASRARLYRHGIEEGLAVSAILLLYLGIQALFFNAVQSAPQHHQAQFLVPAASAVFSLWIWHRFGLWYTFLAAMLYAVPLAGNFTASPALQHSIVAALYAVGLACIVAARSRHRDHYLKNTGSLVEALLWLGIYLALNLRLSSLDVRMQMWIGDTAISAFARPFYWATWALTLCIPLAILARGISKKDRFVIAVGTIAAILTCITNKPYLGWPRHTWDPMLLGIALAGTAMLIRHWLATAPGGIRHGFTAARLSAKDEHWMNAASGALGLVSPHAPTAAPQTDSPDFQPGGGSSGGAGASGDF